MVLTRGAEPETNGAGAAPRRRATGRRAALPNGRAVVGGLLVAAAAVGTFVAWSSANDDPSTRFVVATRDLAVGEVVEAGDLELVPLEAPPGIASAAFEEADAGLAIGQVTVAPVAAGDLLQRSAVVVPEDAEPTRQLSFPIDVADALAGTIERGERVDVLVTFGGDDAATEVVVRDATVAEIRGEDDDASGQIVLLLSIPDDADLLALATAIRRGDLTLVRTTGAG
jgi:Flp pilus assembly protein CpaB